MCLVHWHTVKQFKQRSFSHKSTEQTRKMLYHYSNCDSHNHPVVKVDRRIRWHYTTTILRLRIGARLTRYRNCKFHNFARTISRHADGISRYSVPPSAGPLLPLQPPYMGPIRQIPPNFVDHGDRVYLVPIQLLQLAVVCFAGQCGELMK